MVNQQKEKTHFDAAIKRAERFNPHLHNLSSTSVRWCNICIKFTDITLFTSPRMLQPR